MRVLVTGLSGFTGQYMKAELESSGHNVFGLSADLTDENSLGRAIQSIRPEAVIHLAAIAFVGHGNTKSFYEVNLIGTHNLLKAIERYCPEVTSILIASSANIYGNRSSGALDETVKPAPVNDYAVSKYAMEMMVDLWKSKLPVFITRPFNYTGIGQDLKFLIPKIVDHFKRKAPTIELGNIDVWRDFGDVRSVVMAYRMLLETPPVGQTVNVCTSKECSLKEVLSQCEAITEHEIDVHINPEFVRPNEVAVLKGDNKLLTSLLQGWSAIEFNETLSWMLSEGIE